MMSVKSFLRLYCFLFASFGFSPEAKRELGQENQARLDAEAHGVEAEKKKKKKTKEETKGTSSVEQKGSLTQKVLDLFWKTDEGDSNTVGVGRMEIAKVKTEDKTPVYSSLMQLGGFEHFFTTPVRFPLEKYKPGVMAFKDLAGLQGLVPLVGEGLEVLYDGKSNEWKYSFVKDRQVKLQWHAEHKTEWTGSVDLVLDDTYPTAKALSEQPLTYQLSSTVKHIVGGVKVTPTLHIFKGKEQMLVEFEETEISKPKVQKTLFAKMATDKGLTKEDITEVEKLMANVQSTFRIWFSADFNWKEYTEKQRKVKEHNFKKAIEAYKKKTGWQPYYFEDRWGILESYIFEKSTKTAAAFLDFLGTLP